MTAPVLAQLADLEHPWLGLESFREETRAFFFGRDNEIAEIHLRLRSHPLLVLYGRSGLGKTSILTAGLLPRLRAESRHPLLVRLRYEDSSTDAVAQLVAAVFDQDISPNEWLQQTSAQLGLALPQDSASLLWLRLHYRAAPPITTDLILDQFEEVFTLGARQSGVESAVRDALAIFLQGSLPEPISRLVAEQDNFFDRFNPDSVPVRVILALRDDYVYALNRWRRHLAALGQNSFELRALRGSAAFDAVFKPGELRCHYRGEVKEENRAETGLPPIADEQTAQRIVRFVANKGEDVPLDEIEAVPPILSLLCRELNERRFASTPPALQITFREGEADIGSIITAFYERCLANKPEAVRIFIEEELVSVSGARLAQDEGSILRVFTEGFEIPGAVDGRRAAGFGNATAARSCLRELVNDRLLNSLGGEAPVYELIHDLLAGVAEKSRTAREQRLEKEEAERHAQREKVAKEQAEAQVSRARRTAALVSVLLVLAVIAGIIGYAQKRRAEAATARATRTRAAAEDVIGFMTFDLRDKLEQIGRVDLLHDVNDRVHQYYESFAGSEGETPDMLRQRGAMFANRGNVALDQGDLAQAEKDYREFLSISQKLSQEKPDNILWQSDLALAHANLGAVQQSKGDLDGALTSQREGLAVHERLVRQKPDDRDVQAGLARTYVRIGDILRGKGDLAAAYKNYQDAVAIQRKLAEQDQNDITRKRALCVTYDALGDVQTMQGNIEGALKNYGQAFAIRDELAKENPNDLSRQWELSASQTNMALVQKAQGDVAAATKSFNASLAIRKRLSEQDPQNTNWLRGLAEIYENIGDVQRSRGDLRGAFANYADGLAIRQQLSKRDPNNAGWDWDRSATLMLIGDVQKVAGKLADAVKTYSDSLAIRQRLLEKNPGNATGERETCVNYDRLGEVQQKRGNLADALKNFRQFASTAEKLVKQDPTNAEFQSALSFSYDRIGDVLDYQGDYAGALENYRRVFAIWERLTQQDRQNVDWRWQLAYTRWQMADIFLHEGDGSAALENIGVAFAIAQELVPKDPGSAFHRWDISTLHLLRALAHRTQKNFDDAIKDGAACLEIREKLCQQDPGNAEWSLGLASTFNEVGKIQIEKADAAGAQTSFGRSRELLEKLAERAPENAFRISEHGASQHGTADAQRLNGEIAAAFKNYREALATRERLTQRDQTNAHWQGDLALTCWRMGMTILNANPKSKTEAIKLIERGREILRNLKSHASLMAEQQEWLDEMEADLAKLKK